MSSTFVRIAVAAGTLALATACGGDLPPDVDGGPGDARTELPDAAPVPCEPSGARSEIVSLAVGEAHNCVLLGSSEVACWGQNDVAQLGRTDETPIGTPAVVIGTSTASTLGCASALSAGEGHSCAGTPEGVACWGARLGESGYGAEPQSLAIPAASVVVAGARYSCALIDGGRVTCWGSGYRGQLGDGTTTDEVTQPVRVIDVDGEGELEGITSLSAGSDFACAVMSDGRVACWGGNSWGQLGLAAPDEMPTPTVVEGVSDIVEVSTGGGHVCARSTTGTVTCWGKSDFGQAGVADTRSVGPTAIALPGTAVEVEAGGSHTCARTDDGAVYCWGFNGRGQLGDGSTTDRTAPTRVLGTLGGVRDLGAGALHTCALLADGVTCWGAGEHGQVGGSGDAMTPRSVSFAL